MSNKKQKDTQNNSRVTQKLPNVRHKNVERKLVPFISYPAEWWISGYSYYELHLRKSQHSLFFKKIDKIKTTKWNQI